MSKMGRKPYWGGGSGRVGIPPMVMTMAEDQVDNTITGKLSALEVKSQAICAMSVLRTEQNQYGNGL